MPDMKWLPNGCLRTPSAVAAGDVWEEVPGAAAPGAARDSERGAEGGAVGGGVRHGCAHDCRVHPVGTPHPGLRHLALAACGCLCGIDHLRSGWVVAS